MNFPLTEACRALTRVSRESTKIQKNQRQTQKSGKLRSLSELVSKLSKTYKKTFIEHQCMDKNRASLIPQRFAELAKKRLKSSAPTPKSGLHHKRLIKITGQ